MKILAKIENSQIIFFSTVDEWKWKNELKNLEGKNCIISIEKRTRKRTNNQNKYYWGVVIPIIAEWCGYTKDEVHDFLRAKFLLQKGGKIPKIKSTTSLNTKEFSEYWEKIVLYFSQEHNLVIPFPDDPYIESLFYEYENKKIL